MHYINPALFGILSQAGVAILLVAVTVYAFFSKKIKALFHRVFKNKAQEEAPVSDDPNKPA